MLTVVLPILPLLLVALIGFVVAKNRLIGEAEFAGIGRFLVLCAVPALLFGAVSRTQLSGFSDYAFPFVFAASSLIAGAISYWSCRTLLRQSRVDSSTFALGATFPNSIAIGFPVAHQILGESIVPLFAVVVLVETLVFLPLGLLLLETASADRSHGSIPVARLLRRVLVNPILIAILTGLCVSGSGLGPPAIVYEAVDLLGRSVAATALFFAGGLVARADMSLIGPATLIACAAKLLIAPLSAVFLSVYLLSDRPLVASAAILFAAAPSLSSLSAISVPYGTERAAANVQGLSSTLALLTIPLCALLTTFYHN
jgi:predicted permease